MKITPQNYFQLLTTYLRPQWPRVVVLSLSLLAGIGLQLVAPQILRFFIDAALAGRPREVLLPAALAFLGVGVLNQAFSALATYFGARVGWTATNRLREDVAAHCLELDMPFHNERTPGEMIERIDGDITHLSNFFSQLVVRIWGGALLCAGVLLLLYREDWRAGAVLTIFAAMALVVLLRFRNVAVPASRVQREASSRLFGFMEEKLAGVEDIRANAGGPYVLDRFFRANHHFFHKTRKAWMMHSLLWILIIGMFTIGDVLALGTGYYLYRLDAITVGTVVLFFHYTQMLRAPLQVITRQLQDLQHATAGIARVNELLQQRSSTTDGTHTRLPPAPFSVQFDCVRFGYHPQEPVLHDLSFRVEPGASLGLIGRTGSGKTTVTRLLFRLYDPDRGQVRVGDVDVRAFEVRRLRQGIGMVTQHVQLFHASVRDNLTFFNRRVPDKAIHRVIEELGLAEWYHRMPRGLDTLLSAGSASLSAGEAQLLAFTRIFLKNPGLVVLDEPSSRMDPATERMVKVAIRRLIRKRTAIIIAHRLSTLHMVDDILLLDEGRVMEYGSREQLAADPASRFHQLLRIGREGEVA